MDLSELIKSYTPDQKNVFTAFCINWPLAFSCMFAYEPSFRGIDFQFQLIFSATASILSVAVSYVILLLIYAILGIQKRCAEIGLLSSFGIITSFILLMQIGKYGNGARYAISVVRMMLVFPFLELLVIVFTKERDKKRKPKKDITTDNS